MKKVFFFLISFLVGIGLFAWIIDLVGWQEVKNSFFIFTGWQGAVILFLTFLIMLVGSLKWKEAIKGTGADISFEDIWRIYLASFSIRFLFPIFAVGARFFQAYLLKEKNSVSWPRGMASVTIDFVLESVVILATILFGGFFFFFKIGFPRFILAVVFGSLFLIFFVGLFFFYSKIFKKESIAKAIIKIFNHKLDSQPFEIEKEIFNFFKLKKKIIWKIFALNFLRVAVMFLRVWLLLLFLGKNAGVFSSFSVLGFAYLAAEIPIPMSLGSHEVIQSFAFKFLGLGGAKAAAFTMIIRGADLIFTFFGAVVLFRLGIFLIKDVFSKKINVFLKSNNDRH